MTKTLTIQLERPITSAEFLDDSAFDSGMESSEFARQARQASAEQISQQNTETQKKELSQACRALNIAASKLSEFCEKVVSEQKEEIARLSVEISRKVLMQKVRDGDYEIESIVKEALNSAPTRQDVIVHLNPEDLADCRKSLEQEPDGNLKGVQLVSDSKIGRAECQVESPKGIVESLIDEHLERISKALKKAE
jgi:flagellar biosynthesis/type III secretory pathway protein FliH